MSSIRNAELGTSSLIGGLWVVGYVVALVELVSLAS